MKLTGYFYILLITLLFTINSCKLSNSDERDEKENVEREMTTLLKKVADLEKEREKILELNKQSLKQIKVNEKKRLAAERAEQIRIKADQLELQALYDHKYEKIQQQQRFIWSGFVDKEYSSLTTADGKTYTDAKVISVDATGIALQHQNGVSRIPFAIFGVDVEKQCITDFEKQIKGLKRWLSIETEERELIRNQAKLDAEAEFED